MTNKLKEFRLRAGLTHAELASRVGASALEIYRIEENFSLAGLVYARRISNVLDLPIGTVFPGAAAAVKVLEREVKEPGHVQGETYEKMREVGIEADLKHYTLKVLLRGHTDAMFFPIDAGDATRLLRAIPDESSDSAEVSFFIFNTESLRVAINHRFLMFSQILWDLLIAQPEPENDQECDDDGPSESVQVFFRDDSRPVCLGVEAESGDEEVSYRNYLSAVFMQLENRALRSHERLHIVDEDGESAFLRAADVALLSCPRWVLEPGSYDFFEIDE